MLQENADCVIANVQRVRAGDPASNQVNLDEYAGLLSTRNCLP
jgi:hypothetical protein